MGGKGNFSSGIQRRLWSADEPLPSQEVLTGQVLSDRRREARARLREALGACPDGFSSEEWAVVLATLAPPGDLGPSGRVDRARQARDCFPGLTAPAALRAWLEVSARPHVAGVVADFRALEAVDVLAQREAIREVLGSVLQLGADLVDLRAVDPHGAARCGAEAVAAAKVLIDLDDLRVKRTVDGESGDAPRTAAAAIGDPLAELRSRVALVAEDVRRRAGELQGP